MAWVISAARLPEALSGIFYVSGKEEPVSVTFCETDKPSADVVIVYISGTGLAVEGAAGMLYR